MTAGTTTITSATANFGTDVVGNLIYVSGGTGAVTADWYEITVRTNSTTITVDRSTGLTAGTGVTLNIGGALLSPAIAAQKATAGNKVYVKSGTYGMSSTPNVAAGCMNPTTNNGIHVEGYASTHGDLGTSPVFRADNNSMTVVLFGGSAHYVGVVNIKVDGNAKTSVTAFTMSSVRQMIRLCTALGVAVGFEGQGTSACTRCFADTCTVGFKGRCSFCVASACTTGFGTTQGTLCTNCVAIGGTTGFQGTAGQAMCCVNCLAYGQSGDGFDVNQNGTEIINCLAHTCGGFGFDMDASGTNSAYFLNCFYYSCTSGSDRGTSLASDPLTNAAGGDYSLNSDAAGGALLRQLGFPGVLLGISGTTGYMDVGPYQAQATGGMLVHPGMSGRIG